MCGDYSAQTLEYFNGLLEDLFVPLLMNPLNQNDWPKMLKRDIYEKCHELAERVTVIRGNISNKTVLPLPMNIDEIIKIVEGVLAG